MTATGYSGHEFVGPEDDARDPPGSGPAELSLSSWGELRFRYAGCGRTRLEWTATDPAIGSGGQDLVAQLVVPRLPLREPPATLGVLAFGFVAAPDQFAYFTAHPYGRVTVTLTGCPAASSASACGTYWVALGMSAGLALEMLSIPPA
jgi:hypothetical protein